MTYTDKEVAVLVKAAEAGPISYDRAVEIGSEIGRSTKSVIAKVLSLGLAYERKPAAETRPKGMTKADLVRTIEARKCLSSGFLDGLEKANTRALERLMKTL